MCIPCLDPMKNPADLNTADLDTNKGLVTCVIQLWSTPKSMSSFYYGLLQIILRIITELRPLAYLIRVDFIA